MRGLSKKHREYAPQFSIRFTVEEREQLEREAGNSTVTAHIRYKLFGDDQPTQRRKVRKRRQPPIDYVMLGRVLGLLGKSELASSLCLMAVAAEAGALPVTDEVESEIKVACTAILDMRHMLIVALGVKPEPGE